MVREFVRIIRSVYFSGAACIVLLALCAVPKINSVILDEDTSSAFTLNSVVGHSPVMDHLVLAFSDRSADERALLLLFVVAVVYISSARDRRHLAERLALIVFLVATCAAGVASEEFIEQTVRRRSPSLELTNFKDIEQLYDFDVDQRNGDTFPSDDGFGYFLLGFILLRLGYRVGLGLIVGGLVFPLARCVVGSQWISDIYLGALPMSVFISAVVTETRVVRLREVLESRILNGLDRSRLVIRRLLHLARYLVRWRRENILTIHAAVKRYANTEVRRLLSLEQNEPLNLEMPLTGNKSLIWFATSGNRRALLRAYPLSMQIKAELHREASFLLQEHKVNVPAILDYQFEPTRYPAIIMLEEYVEGESLRQSKMTSEHIQAMASQFSRMHAIRNQAWGRLGYERSEGFCSVIMRHVERDLAVARRTNLLTDMGLKNYLHDWFTHWKKELEGIGEYSLTHNDVHYANGVFTPSGEYYIIDLTRFHWYPASKELVRIYRRLLGGIESRISTFEQKYFSDAGEKQYREFARQRPFFEAMYMLDQLVKKSSRATRVPARDEELGESRDYAWEQLLQIVRA